MLLYLQSIEKTAQLIQIPLRISLPLGDLSLTGFLSVLFNMIKFHSVIFNKVQRRGIFTLVKSVLSPI